MIKVKNIIQQLENRCFFPHLSRWLFVFLFLIMAYFYNYHEVLFKAPQSLHQWRQTDCLSLTLNYYQNNNPLFEPTIHHLGENGNGKVISEFPVFYWFVAQLWRVFGTHEFIYRLLVILFFFSGLFAVFKLMEDTIKDSLLALIGSLLLFTSPVLVYYANNFLMDIPAFSLALIGLYFFTRYCKSGSIKYFWFFALSFTFAGLLKISSLLGFAAILVLYIMERFNISITNEGRIFRTPIIQGIILFAVLAVQFIWYSYARAYNLQNNANFFLLGILPIWEISMAEIRITYDFLVHYFKNVYFRSETQILFILMFLINIVFYRKASKTLSFMMMLMGMGMLGFVLMFYQALRHHDYYTINLYILFPVIWTGFFLFLKVRFNRVFTSIFLKIALLAFLVWNIMFASLSMKARYHPEGWENENYIVYVQNFRTIGAYLNSIGVAPDDKVLSISDNSPNISLYLMNRKGWTNFGINEDSAKIQAKIQMGASYLFVYRPQIYERKDLAVFFSKPLGSYKNIDVFSLEGLYEPAPGF